MGSWAALVCPEGRTATTTLLPLDCKSCGGRALASLGRGATFKRLEEAICGLGEPFASGGTRPVRLFPAKKWFVFHDTVCSRILVESGFVGYQSITEDIAITEHICTSEYPGITSNSNTPSDAGIIKYLGIVRNGNKLRNLRPSINLGVSADLDVPASLGSFVELRSVKHSCAVCKQRVTINPCPARGLGFVSDPGIAFVGQIVLSRNVTAEVTGLDITEIPQSLDPEHRDATLIN